MMTTLRRMTRALKSHGRAAILAACALSFALQVTPVWAQAPGAMPAPEGRGYTVQYIMVVLLSAMAVGAVCKSSYRQAKNEE
jgi:hypothetical protein